MHGLSAMTRTELMYLFVCACVIILVADGVGVYSVRERRYIYVLAVC